ncbi:hypothetical protein A3A69_00620 [candidate division WWE3 bacterium RIFCSPLOWO2_01_FULL_37_15]|uniref:Uracil-DNA glycosylase-like domain-containing protein n=1 Tax=candidate division WWE3 bacterium RIFCSPLOWO2_01_FULL_37_15 TaxID=1802622 RepID=A0A1F4USS7_UNCKA|nr:MAG: hypothetical protein A3A69_00620 [candidate division WWE3 bacterium RIFCSPLOWO2_01_FULL_37_15]
MHEHFCDDPQNFPIDKFLQKGIGKGKKVLIIGESPAPNGWRKSGNAFYTIKNKLLPTGKNLNKLLNKYGLSVENCRFTELVKCFVGKDRKLLSSCGEKCWPVLIKQIANDNSEFLIILGVKTLELFNKLSKQHLEIGKIQKVELEGKFYIVLAIYHPSPISPIGHKRNVEIFNTLDSSIEKLLK